MLDKEKFLSEIESDIASVVSDFNFLIDVFRIDNGAKEVYDLDILNRSDALVSKCMMYTSGMIARGSLDNATVFEMDVMISRLTRLIHSYHTVFKEGVINKYLDAKVSPTELLLSEATDVFTLIAELDSGSDSIIELESRFYAKGDYSIFMLDDMKTILSNMNESVKVLEAEMTSATELMESYLLGFSQGDDTILNNAFMPDCEDGDFKRIAHSFYKLGVMSQGESMRRLRAYLV